MSWKAELKKFAAIAAVLAGCYFLPLTSARFGGAILESLHLLREYARQHVLLCLVPALFIAGGIASFISKASVMKYLGAKANKVLAFAVASISGSVLAVCSCTVLPLFAGIYRMGAGIGPATTFLYSGPAINILAIILTARVLGLELGIARAIGAVVFSIVIGLAMSAIFRKADQAKAAAAAVPDGQVSRPLWKTASVFAAMVATLIFANWARSGDVRAVFLCCPGGLAENELTGTIIARDESGVTLMDAGGNERHIPAEQLKQIKTVQKNAVYERIYAIRWLVVVALLGVLAAMIVRWFQRRQIAEWLEATWSFAKQILPLLFVGVVVAGFLLGRPGGEGIVPSRWVEVAVGGNSPWANFFAAVAGSMMYFATLTEVPILQGLIGAGMGKGPALALLLAGPALSLPNMLVIRSVMGTSKTLVYILLVIAMATASGLIFGAIMG